MAPLLQGETIALSGSHPDYKQANLSSMIKQNGGSVATKVTDACTHLVTTQKDFTARSSKVAQAQNFPDIKIVSLDWLLDSVEEGEVLDEAPYSFTNPKTDNSAPSSKPAMGKKRARTATPEEIDTQKITTSDSKADEEPPMKKQKDGQKAKSGSTLTVPVDEGCILASSHQVYIDTDGTIFDAALNQTNVGNNNNKFYRIQLLYSTQNDDYQTWTRWGRVGEHGQSALLGAGGLQDAIKQFEKKFKDKSGHSWENRLDPPKKGKYTFIERNYEESSDEEDDIPGAGSRRGSKASLASQSNDKPVESALPPAVQRLMALIFNQDYFASTMSELSYDANKLPLGKLSKRTLSAGFQKLKDLAEIIANPAVAHEKHGVTMGEAVATLTNAYYTTIPHSFGRNRPPMISNDHMLKREIDLLESLSDMEIATGIMKDAKTAAGENTVHPLDRQYAGLSMEEMTPLENASNEYKELQDYLIKSHGHTHYLQLKVQDIFRLERNGEKDRFAKSRYAKLKKSDRRLLWHGSRCTNFGGILSQGLRIAPPEAPVSGYMFGKGVYLADISSKSANYCVPSISGNIGLLLLCEAELGQPMLELQGADSNAGEVAKSEGCIATWGQGTTAPQGWKDASCVHEDLRGVKMPDTTEPPGPTGIPNAWLQYNEYIAYDVAQLRLRYLLRVEMK